MSSNTEWEWVNQARQDPEAFRELYRYYVPKVYAFVAHRVPNRQDAEDIVAETFLRVARDLRHFEWRHDASFSAWLFRIARNLVIDFLRRDRTPYRLDCAEHLLQTTSAVSEPEKRVLQWEELTYVREILNRLTPRQQEILTLRFFCGLRNWEIARLVGLDERTVATHLCRGLEELHRQRQRDLTRL